MMSVDELLINELFVMSKKIEKSVEETRKISDELMEKTIEKMENHYEKLVNIINEDTISFNIILEGEKYRFIFSNGNIDLDEKKKEGKYKFVKTYLVDLEARIGNRAAFVINSNPVVGEHLYNRFDKMIGKKAYDYITILIKYENEILDRFKEEIKRKSLKISQELIDRSKMICEMKKYLGNEIVKDCENEVTTYIVTKTFKGINDFTKSSIELFTKDYSEALRKLDVLRMELDDDSNKFCWIAKDENKDENIMHHCIYNDDPNRIEIKLLEYKI